MNFSNQAFDVDRTPIKKVVDCDINGWMETCAKQPEQPAKQPSRYIRKFQAKPSPTTNSNCQKLREFRVSLMQYIALKNSELATPLTADSNGQITITVNKSKNEKSARFPSVQRQRQKSIGNIEVTQFCDSVTQEMISVREKSLRRISHLRLPSVTKRIDRSFNPSTNSDPTIIQNKITQNQYVPSRYLVRKHTSIAKN